MKNKSKIYLASQSPRRHHLLNEHGIDHDIIEQHFDESTLMSDEYTPINYAKTCCYFKATSITHPYDGWILTSDTVVVYDNTCIGKPSSYEEAIQNLLMFSNNTHQVITAVCFYHNIRKQSIVKYRSSQICFQSLSFDDIKRYVHEKKPLDKAGGYGFQELPSHFVKSYTGDATTIIGLPIKLVKKIIQDIHA